MHKMGKILFIHGLASSGAYKMADMLRQLMRPCEVISPDVPIGAQEALGMLEDICAKESPDLVVGLSWGGFLAQKLRGRSKVLVNPDLHISRLMRYISGEVKYLSPRADGAQSFVIDDSVCEAYRTLEQVQYDGLDDAERSLTLGLFAEDDQLVHCHDEFVQYYPGRAKKYPGGHLPTYPDMKFHIVPAIEAFLGTE